MEEKKTNRSARSLKYRYDDLPLVGYGKFGELPDGRIFVPDLVCEGELGDYSQPVSVYVSNVKVGEIPHDARQRMWHDFTKRGDLVIAVLRRENNEIFLRLDFEIPSEKVYYDLEYEGYVKVEQVFYNCSQSVAAQCEEYEELLIGFTRESGWTITTARDTLGIFPSRVAALVQNVEDCRVFLKSIEPYGDDRAKVTVHIFLDAPVEVRKTSVRRQKDAEPPSAQPIPQTYRTVSVTFEGNRKALLKMKIDNGAERSVKNGDTDKFKLPEGNHLIVFSCDGYQPQGLNFELKHDTDLSVSLKFWSNSLAVSLRKQYF